MIVSRDRKQKFGDNYFSELGFSAIKLHNENNVMFNYNQLSDRIITVFLCL